MDALKREEAVKGSKLLDQTIMKPKMDSLWQNRAYCKRIRLYLASANTRRNQE